MIFFLSLNHHRYHSNGRSGPGPRANGSLSKQFRELRGKKQTQSNSTLNEKSAAYRYSGTLRVEMFFEQTDRKE